MNRIHLPKLRGFPGAAVRYAAGKWRGYRKSRAMTLQAKLPKLRKEAIQELKIAWNMAVSGKRLAIPAHSRWEMETALPLGETPFSRFAARYGDGLLSCEDQARIEQIRTETFSRNRNNVTRTEAYRKIYLRRPELHWALLAHMVSRNGGWNMTDLQGEWLPRLLKEEDRRAIFQFLERSNAYIFHDAYPQLRLYEHSLSAGRSLFYLLPMFNVSRFMQPAWERFWRDRDPVPLTVALIVNEQHYIEERIVQKPYFRDNVLHTAAAELQKLLQLNAVIFPYGDDVELQLAGLVIENFGDVKERIEFGKSLYSLLFGVPRIFEGTVRFVKDVRHSGSRADYAPLLFRTGLTDSQEPYREKLIGGKLRQGALPLSSPALEEAWPDAKLPLPGIGDWFRTGSHIAKYFQELSLPRRFEMSWMYQVLLNKLELAVLAKERAARLAGRL